MPANNFIEELQWRGMLQDKTPGIEEHLTAGTRRGYIGFDPTARSLTIGNYVQVMILTLFQRCGHQPIVLMGGATGRIGDPSGRDSERDLLSYDVLDANAARQEQQIRAMLRFDDSPNSAILVNNLAFYENMNALEFLRVVGKNLTVNYMLSKESVKKRLETGISFTEFSYQLLQGYDFLCLYRELGCTVQMGGSDQWGNITSGLEFVRRNESESHVFGVTTPLLTKADGSKFGKSESGNLWMDADMTSPYQFYQFWINADDRDIPKYLRYFSLKSREEILALEDQASGDPSGVKRELARELTTRVHSEEAFANTLQVSRILFDRNLDQEALRAMNVRTLEMLANEIPAFQVGQQALNGGLTVTALMATETGICTSLGEARRAIQANAVSVNKEKVGSIEHVVGKADLLHDRFLLVENGKKNKYIIVIS